MEDKFLKVYKASAGSGKTYNLALNYIEHLFQKPDSFKSILAVTFTNKAAGEMKSRILQKLFELSKDDVNAKDYKLHLIENNFAKDEKEVITKSEHILNHILNQYSSFYVQTIDKFFQWVIRGFTREIGLQGAYNLELNQNKILTEAVDLVMLGMDEDKDLRKWLIQFAEEKLEDGKSWNFQSDVFQLGKEVFSENYQHIQETESSSDEKRKKLIELRDKLRKKITAFDSYIKTRAVKALKIIEDEGIEVSDFKYGDTSVPNIFRKVIQKPLSELEIGIRPLQAIEDPTVLYKKGSPHTESILKCYNKGLKLLLKEIITYWDAEKEDYFTNLAIQKNIYAFGILNNISERIQEIVRENNSFLIADSAKFLKKIIAENEAPFIYEKSGNYFNHLMLDEFQDTSGFQWQNFYPLIQNSLASGYSNILVGDVKQAIYRWRSSDWKILATMVDQSFPASILEHRALDVNYRSDKNLVAFNNSVFYHTPFFLKNSIENELIENSDDEFKQYWLDLISKVYEEARQQIPKKHLNTEGYISHQFFPEVNNSEYNEILSEKIPVLIRQLQDRGYKAGDITILVRKGSEGRDIAKILMSDSSNPGQKYNFNVISNDSLYLENSSSVKFLISLLSYFNHKSDKLNKSFLKHEYLIYLQSGLSDNKNYAHNIFTSHDLNGLDLSKDKELEDFEKKYHSFRKLALYELTEELISVFKLNQNEANLAYIQSFQDLVLEYIRKESSDLNAFLNYWESTGKKSTLSISESQDAIKILTIHKAKGLQFKVVIIPFLHWTLEPKSGYNRNTILWPETKSTDLQDFSNIPIKYSSGLKKTGFKKEYFEELFKSFVDHVNLMYVAFTRAENELHSFSKLGKTDKGIKSVAELVYEIYRKSASISSEYPMLSLTENFNTENLVFSYGVPAKPKTEIPESDNINTFLLKEYPVSSKSISLSLNHKNIYLSDLKEEISEKTGYGTQMHEIFASIITKTDVDSALRKAWLKGLITRDESNEMKSQLEGKLKAEPFSDWFSGSWNCKTESDIMDGKGNIFRPDRFMLKEGHAIILDYKFGKIKSSEHHKQMKDYKELLKTQNYKDIRMFLWYYSLNELEEVKQ
ncbi:MAG: UvrD-helicase domain-containing protein [Bacteroidales bacterium]|nr:UvrD-helicase domain-containing protein [Bacteroidales bacterium]MCF8392159.1 UvrD-helicase domain-containing protein [Bacteroidales bacterium]